MNPPNDPNHSWNNLRARFLETRFEMLAEERRENFWVVTAWNPHGHLTDADWNRSADENLREEIQRRGIPRFRVLGTSPDGAHVEPGWGVPCEEDIALELGRMFRQVAIFAFYGDSIDLVDCANGARQRLPDCPNRVVCPREKRIFQLHVGARATDFDSGDEDSLVRLVAGTFPSFTIQSAEGIFRGRREAVRLVSIATHETERVLILAEEIRRFFSQEGVGVSCGGIYQRVCEWSDLDFIKRVFPG